MHRTVEKTTFANLLSSPFKQWEIGNFKIPVKSASTTFWLESLPGTDLYRCEEFCLSEYDIAQIMKSLFEGNPNLEADIKYKSPITVPKRPLIVTMNGKKAQDITLHMSSEYNAFKNRSDIIVMNDNIHTRILNGDLKLMIKHSFVINGLLFKKYCGQYDVIENETDIDFCTDYIEKKFIYIFCFNVPY